MRNPGGFALRVFAPLILAALYGCGDVETTGGADGPGIYDQEGKRLGSWMAEVDFDQGLYEIMTTDGYRAVVDLDDASINLRPEFGGLNCFYKSEDCSGTCYGEDQRYAGFLVPAPEDKGGVIAFPARATPESFKAMSRYDNTAEECQITSVTLSYAPPGSVWTGDLLNKPKTPLYISSDDGN